LNFKSKIDDLKTCVRAINKFNADMTFETYSLREMNISLTNDLEQMKKNLKNSNFNKQDINTSIIWTELKKHIENINKQNYLRLNRRDIQEAKILDE